MPTLRKKLIIISTVHQHRLKLILVWVVIFKCDGSHGESIDGGKFPGNIHLVLG
uniref:Uncharacterized protein n=1 Tax=Helianthus annuus TaxID=4232 RepID=A0A251UIF0_HELAN